MGENGLSTSKQQPNAVVGIALGLGDNNEMIVAGVKPGAPAHRSRMIAPGDQLVRIDGHPVGNGQQLKTVVQRLCGPVGSIVSLGVLKQSGDQLDVVLVREQPSTSLYSSHNNHVPASPGGIRQMQSPVSPDAIPAREGVLHNLYSSTTSVPPEAAGHDMHVSHSDTSDRHNPALAHISLSNVEADAGLVYRPGPILSLRPGLDEIDPQSPVVWPRGINQSMDQPPFNAPAIPRLPGHIEKVLHELQQSPQSQVHQSIFEHPMLAPQQQPSVPQQVPQTAHMNQMAHLQQMQQMNMQAPQNQQLPQHHNPHTNAVPARQHMQHMLPPQNTMGMMARRDMPQPEAISEIGMGGMNGHYNPFRDSSPSDMQPRGPGPASPNMGPHGRNTMPLERLASPRQLATGHQEWSGFMRG